MSNIRSHSIFHHTILFFALGAISANPYAQTPPSEQPTLTPKTSTSQIDPTSPAVIDNLPHPLPLVNSIQTDPEDTTEKAKTIKPLAPELYSLKTFGNDMRTIKWDAIGTFAGITALGLKSWKWGNSNFHFHNEKWFQKDRSSIGMDKLGHAYSSYVMTNLFAEHLQRKGRPLDRSALSAALLTQGLMLYVEAFDGFSTDHGFAYEDVLMNASGTTLAYLRQRYPKIKDLVDYRMEYSPSGFKGDGIKGFRPISDYSGQKYHLAFKMSGVPALRDTPLKYLELNAGYYARGFTTRDIAENKPRVRNAFVGVGINLNELLFGKPQKDESIYTYSGRKLFEFVQLPTYARVGKTTF